MVFKLRTQSQSVKKEESQCTKNVTLWRVRTLFIHPWLSQ